MKRRNVLFSLLAAVVALLFLLSACGAAPAEADASAPAGDTQASQSDAADCDTSDSGCQGSINMSPAPLPNSGSQEAPVADGVLSQFTATDLDGNDVDQSVFTGKKLTMVNIWATFCGPCIGEMPELGELSEEYADGDVQIVGIPVDVTDRSGNLVDDMVAAAREIVDETGANYLHILPSASLIEAKLGEVYSVPETIFVDENGVQVGESYVGARSKEAWAAIIDELLGQMA